MPAWILWLSPVIVAPLLAVAWITWAARPKGPEPARESVEQYDRFRAALAEADADGKAAGSAAVSDAEAKHRSAKRKAS